MPIDVKFKKTRVVAYDTELILHNETMWVPKIPDAHAWFFSLFGQIHGQVVSLYAHLCEGQFQIRVDTEGGSVTGELLVYSKQHFRVVSGITKTIEVLVQELANKIDEDYHLMLDYELVTKVEEGTPSWLSKIFAT